MRHVGLARYAWAVLVVNILVILWGVFVRASGSGAGCGSHWPACNGAIIPRVTEQATSIEFFHRATSGLAFLLVVGLLIWAWRSFPKGSAVRLVALLSFIFICLEALIGAGLVLFGLTAKNDSVARAIVLAVHLVNTFLLLGALVLTAWWASSGRTPRWRGQSAIFWPLMGGLLGMIAVGALGAVTALGDTLFPAGTLLEGVRQDLSPTAHFLVQLRVIHPVLAVVVGLATIWLSLHVQAKRVDRVVQSMARLVGLSVIIQLGVGMLNLFLLAPVAMQLIHLLMADLIWIALVLLTAAAMAVPARQPESRRAAELALGGSD